MELTEEVLKSIRQQATDASTTGTNFPQGADDVTTLAMVEEIERLRAVVAQQATEIEALRAEVESRQRMYESEGEMRRQSERLVEKLTWFNNTLNATPDAAPAPVEPAARRPMLGDTLKNAITEGKRVFVKATGERGIVFSIFSTEGGRKYRVEHGGEYADYNRDEIELAPVEAAAAREIAVGDRVRIIVGYREGEIGTVTQEPDAVISTYTVRTGDGVVGGHSFAEYEQNEIEPA